jgi:hypothetical protein
MSSIFTIAGRLTGKMLSQPHIAETIRSIQSYVQSGIQSAEIRLRLEMLRKKRERHFIILGRTFYRLMSNDVNPFNASQVNTTIKVLGEIDLEIETVESEWERRKAEMEDQKRNRS